MKLLLFCLLGLPLIVGCGNSLGIVKGTVTLDGQPVPAGNVTFVKQDEANPAREGAVISNGKFQAKIPPGKYKLELNGQKVTGSRTQKNFDGNDDVLPLSSEMFPDIYNTQSTLIEDIKPGPQPIKLDLNSKP